MISIKKDFDEIPEGLQSENCKNKIQEALTEKNEHDFSSYCYRHSTVLEALYTLYHNKCAYCETNTLAGASLQVEHFRPKAKVTEQPFDKTTQTGHRGYYWLGYEWSNLLLSCQKCNEQGAKGNHFPIENEQNRLQFHPCDTNNELETAKCKITAQCLQDEKPLLLNPETDEVELHLIFLPTGEVRGITDKGKKTIEVLKLNREHLILARKEKFDELKNRIDLYIRDFAIGSINEDTLRYNVMLVFQEIIEKTKPQYSYSRLYHFMWFKFDLFFTKTITNTVLAEKLREIKQQYLDFINKT